MVVTVRCNVGGAVGTLRAMRQAFQPPMHPELRKAFHQVADRHDAYNGSRFDRIGVSGGVGEWAPLKPRTVAEKKRKGYPPNILVRTRNLRRSLEKGHPDHVRQDLPNGVRTGTKERKAIFHQKGAPGRNLPARELEVAPHPQLVREMTGILAAGMRKVIAAANAAAPKVPTFPPPPSMN